MAGITSRRREGFPGQRLFILPPAFVSKARRDPLLKGLFLTAAGFFPEAPGHLVRRPAGIRETILISCVAGRGWVELEGKKRIQVQPGEIVFISSETPHVYGADERTPWSIMWAHFQGRDQARFAGLLEVTPQDPIIRLPAGNLEFMRFDELFLTMEAGVTVHSLLRSSSRLRMILVDLLRLRVPASQQSGLNPEVFRKNIDWMNSHRQTKVGLAELAAQAGLSIPHYSACFKRRVGISPMNYFHRLKIQYAAQLLALTDLGISEVAHAVGLEDPFYFSRFF